MDGTGSEVRQILQGVTEWVASMVGSSADPFDDLVSVERSGELSSITAHVADTIFQMAGALEGIGASSDVKEITYELDLGVSHRCNYVCLASSPGLPGVAIIMRCRASSTAVHVLYCQTKISDVTLCLLAPRR